MELAFVPLIALGALGPVLAGLYLTIVLSRRGGR
jgi:hypothetical protein